jgi:hypothetical protein
VRLLTINRSADTQGDLDRKSRKAASLLAMRSPGGRRAAADPLLSFAEKGLGVCSVKPPVGPVASVQLLRKPSSTASASRKSRGTGRRDGEMSGDAGLETHAIRAHSSDSCGEQSQSLPKNGKPCSHIHKASRADAGCPAFAIGMNLP